MKKINHQFRTTVDDLSVGANAEAALNAATEAYMLDKERPGSVMCQLHRTPGGTLVLSGTFVEYDYAYRINEILKERKRDYQRESTERS